MYVSKHNATMTLYEALIVLKEHQEWRLGANTHPMDPKLLTEAMEVAINLLTQLNKQK